MPSPSAAPAHATAGLGATNVCDLERCQPDDALLPLLACGQAPTSLVVFTTQLLTETHQHVVHLLMVRGTRPCM